MCTTADGVATETLLWSGSVDSTIRVWDLASGKCVGVLSAVGGAGGHTEAVSCMELIPGSPEAFIASGGSEGAVKIWKASGSLVHTCSHTSMVTALRAFKDSNGGTRLPYLYHCIGVLWFTFCEITPLYVS
jgi:WD40 repeat protein